MWTAGFPEPRTFSLRVARLLRRAARRLRRGARQPDARLRDARASSEAGLPLVTTIHHPITFDRRIDLAAAPTLAQRLTLRRWYGFLRMQGRVARRLGTVLTAVASRRARDIVTRLRGRPGADRRWSRSASTTCSAPPTEPRVPGRIVAMASADTPMKGIATLLEAFAKLRTEREVELLLVTQAQAGRPHRAARRPARRSATRCASCTGISDARAGRGDGLRRGRLRAVALRGLLAADRRGDGLRDAAGRQPGRRDPRGRRARRAAAPTWSPPATWASSSPRWPRCSTTPSAGPGWARAGRERALERVQLAGGRRGAPPRPTSTRSTYDEETAC